jgi:hypothetical protein
MDPAFLTIAELNQLQDQRDLSLVGSDADPLDRIVTYRGHYLAAGAGGSGTAVKSRIFHAPPSRT